MTLELISARKKIKQYIKQMPDSSDREYLNKVQLDLKSFINNTRNKSVAVNKIYGNTDISIWSIEQNFIDSNVTLILRYIEETKLYEFEWCYGLTHAFSYRHVEKEKLQYNNIQQFIISVFNKEFICYAKY